MSAAPDSLHFSPNDMYGPRVYVINTRRPRKKPRPQRVSFLQRCRNQINKLHIDLDMEPWKSQVEVINEFISVQRRCYLWAMATACLTIAMSI